MNSKNICEIAIAKPGFFNFKKLGTLHIEEYGAYPIYDQVCFHLFDFSPEQQKKHLLITNNIASHDLARIFEILNKFTFNFQTKHLVKDNELMNLFFELDKKQIIPTPAEYAENTRYIYINKLAALLENQDFPKTFTSVKFWEILKKNPYFLSIFSLNQAKEKALIDSMLISSI